MKSVSFEVGFFIIGMIIFGQVEAWGGDWILFDSNDKEIRYYYHQSQKRQKDIIGIPNDTRMRVWVKVEYTDKGLSEMAQKLGENYQNFMYMTMEQELDCPFKKWRNLSSHYYSKEGKIIESSSRAGAWKPIRPGSTEETLCKAVYKES